MLKIRDCSAKTDLYTIRNTHEITSSLLERLFLLKKNDNIDSKAGEYDKIGCRHPSGR